MEQTEQVPINTQLGSRAAKYMVIMAVVVLIVGALFFFTDVGKGPEALRAERKKEMLNVVNNASASPLTEKQKAEILKEFGGSNTSEYNFTEAEREQVLRALNGK